MKLNRKWLNEEFVDLSHVSDKEYVEKLTVFAPLKGYPLQG